jgi:hypothetical protein
MTIVRHTLLVAKTQSNGGVADLSDLLALGLASLL